LSLAVDTGWLTFKTTNGVGPLFDSPSQEKRPLEHDPGLHLITHRRWPTFPLLGRTSEKITAGPRPALRVWRRVCGTLLWPHGFGSTACGATILHHGVPNRDERAVQCVSSHRWVECPRRRSRRHDLQQFSSDATSTIL